MKDYFKDLLNKLGNLLLVIVTILMLLIHLGGNKLSVTKDSFRFEVVQVEGY